jgi:hypothetical protein
MFYINSQAKGSPLSEKELLTAMLVPCEERTSSDHQAVYGHFGGNELLCEMERSKSLNARIKCVAGLLLVSSEEIVPKEHIVMHRFLDMRAVVLPVKVKAEVEQYDERPMRRRMDRLNCYAVMAPLHYDALLYLASHMEEVSLRFKEYLYREGQEADCIFLVEEGEFCYVKDSGDERSV